MTAQPGAIINHPAWQLGHLTWALDSAVALVGGAKTLDADWVARFVPNSIPSADRSHYPANSELTQLCSERRQTVATRCAKMSDSDWQQPNPIPQLQAMLPTLWQAMHFLMLTHESTHLGQIASWRRAMNLPMALSKPR